MLSPLQFWRAGHVPPEPRDRPRARLLRSPARVRRLPPRRSVR